MSTHAAVQKRRHEESAPLHAGPGKPSQAAGVGLPLFMQANPTASAGVTLQRKCASGGTPGANDECETCNGGKFLQAKLAIGASDDPLEQEADRVADQVLAMPANSTVSAAPPRIQRYTGQATGETGTAPASVDHVLASSGRPLDATLQQDMGQRFGHDFSNVRVHSGSEAEQSAREVNAHAYTVGNNIVFGEGRFAPESQPGRRLLAHELTHVVQQSGTDGMNVCQSNDERGLSPIIPIIPSALLQRNEDDRPPTPDQLREQARKDIGELEKQLDDAVRRADNRLGELGSRAPTPTAPQPQPQPGPYGDPISDRDRQKARRTPVQPGSKKDIAQRRNRVENELRRVARGGGPHAAEAQGILDDLAQRQKEIRVRVIDRKAHYKPYGPKPPPATADKPGAKVDKPPAKPPPATEPVKTGAKVGGKAAAQGTAAEVKGAATEAKAVGAEAKVAGAEAKAIKAETAAADVVAGAAKATKAARLGRLLMALALPGPLDVLFLYISFFGSLAEAKAKLRADAYALGFAQGLAAVITWTQAADAERMLLYKAANPSIGERVAGFEGVREKGNNDGVMAGWKFGNALNGAQRKGFRAEALAATGLKERRHSSRDDLIAMGVALKLTVVELLAEAERQERLAEERRLANLRPPRGRR